MITRRGLFKLLIAAPFVAAVKPAAFVIDPKAIAAALQVPVSMLGFAAKFPDGKEYFFNGFVGSDANCSGGFYDRDRGWVFFNTWKEYEDATRSTRDDVGLDRSWSGVQPAEIPHGPDGGRYDG